MRWYSLIGTELKLKTKPLAVTVDTEANAGYVNLTNKAVSKTVEVPHGEGLALVDYDAEGEVRGVELLGFSNLAGTLEELGIPHSMIDSIDRPSR